MATLRGELRAEMGELRGELGQVEGRLSREVASHTRYYMATTVGAVLTTGALAFTARLGLRARNSRGTGLSVHSVPGGQAHE